MTPQDEAIHKGLMKLLDEAEFRLLAREVKSFLVIYDWAKNLPAKLKAEQKALPAPQPPAIKKKRTR